MKVISQILPKIGCHCNVLKGIKRGPDRENLRKYLSFGEKIVKIGPVDPEIIWLKLITEEIMEGKIYSPVGRFAERAKQFLGRQVRIDKRICKATVFSINQVDRIHQLPCILQTKILVCPQ